MKEESELMQWYQKRFEVFEKNLNGEAESSIHSTRRAGLARFRELGFPTTKHEEWRFTNVTPIAETEFIPAEVTDNHLSQKQIDSVLLEGPHRLVFVNGHFASGLSKIGAMPRGVIVGSLASLLKEKNELASAHLARYASFDENAFVALNTAFVRDGAFLSVPEGVRIEEPIHVVFVANGDEGTMISPRNIYALGKKTHASIIETYATVGTTTHFSNVVTEVSLDEHSMLEHDKLQNEGKDSFHISATTIHQRSRSNYVSNSFAFGGAIARNNITSVLDAENCECTLNGLSLGTGSQLIDNHTTIDHAKPHCSSHELYKAILDGKARGVFNGKIFVRLDAQKTDAKQTNKTLLLSDTARIDTKPQLEIFADDVKCTHGATVGQLDEDQIFYLRSRGIDRTMARDLLTFAFAGDVVNRVRHEGLRKQLEELVHKKLDEGRARS